MSQIKYHEVRPNINAKSGITGLCIKRTYNAKGVKFSFQLNWTEYRRSRSKTINIVNNNWVTAFTKALQHLRSQHIKLKGHSAIPEVCRIDKVDWLNRCMNGYLHLYPELHNVGNIVANPRPEIRDNFYIPVN